MNKVSSILWGIILIVIGVIFGINALGIADVNIFFDGWWTLFIIVPCFVGLFKNESKIGNIIGLIIGLALLLACQDVINFELIFKLMVPCILILIGLSIIFKDIIGGKIKDEIKKINKSDFKEYVATFGGQNVDFVNEEFKGCSLSAVFGEVKCDLNGAIIKSDVVIDVSAIFGAVSIYVPDDVNVKITSVPIFGGVSDSRKNKQKDCKHTIYIKSTAMFGGIEIK